MSELADEAYDVYDERLVRARRPHECDACRETIPRGDRYCRVNMIADRSAETVKRCLRCQRIHEHLRALCRSSGSELWPDERLNCGLRYEDEWGPLPDEIAALAFVTGHDLQERSCA